MSISKSGTTTIHNYFQCGDGLGTSLQGSSVHDCYSAIVKKKTREPGGKSKGCSSYKRETHSISDTMRYNIDRGLPCLSPKSRRITNTTTSTATYNNSSNSNSNATTITEEEQTEIQFFDTHGDELSRYSVFVDFESFDNLKKRNILWMTDMLENVAEFYPNATLLYVRTYDAIPTNGPSRRVIGKLIGSIAHVSIESVDIEFLSILISIYMGLKYTNNKMSLQPFFGITKRISASLRPNTRGSPLWSSHSIIRREWKRDD